MLTPAAADALGVRAEPELGHIRILPQRRKLLVTQLAQFCESERLVLEHPKRGTMFGPPKSHRSERTIALDPGTVAALRDHRATQQLERQLAGPAYRDQDLVFASELGEPISPTRLSVSFTKARKAAGIPVGTLHTLRHTAATVALTEGVPLHVVAARLGDDPRTVLGTYAHLLPHSDAQAAIAVGSVLDDKALTNEPKTR